MLTNKKKKIIFILNIYLILNKQNILLILTLVESVKRSDSNLYKLNKFK